MAIKTTRWEPDTCGCVIEYEWDDELPAIDRVHTLSAVVNKHADCHPATEDGKLMDVILDENRRKNAAVKIVTDIDAAIEPEWSFTKDRALELSLPADVPALKAAEISDACDLALGAGKVSIV